MGNAAASATDVDLAEKMRAYRDGYAARAAGLPLDAYHATTHVGPVARQGWEDGWRDRAAGKPDLHAPASDALRASRVWALVAVLFLLLVACSFLPG